ncbi:unnamed protein product [Phaeothamnion confervicola]
MRHRMRIRRLGRQTDHRLSMLKNMAKSLLAHKRITTTETRAKELSRYIDGIITFAKRAHASTDASVKLANKRQVFQLFEQLAVKYSEGGDSARSGGYTRIIRLEPRKGDGAPMALIELV